jgi:hypothetical protein
MWTVGTAVHLASLDYVFDVKTGIFSWAVVACALLWTVHFRLWDLVEKPRPILQTISFVAPGLTAMIWL